VSKNKPVTYRGYLIDHHSPDPPVVTLDQLRIEDYERFFIESNINHLMVYCKDHWGVTYYDSAVGKRHPGLKEDWVAQLVPVMRKLGIEFNAYYCMEYDSLAPVMHPEWSILTAEGEPMRLTGRLPKWGMPCYETGYRQYVLTQLAEIAEKFRPDNLFLDIFGKSLCYCPSCQTKFQQSYGFSLPTGDALKEHRMTVNEFLDRCAKEMLEDILTTVKGIHPEIQVTINFAALYAKEIRDLLDFQFTEPWAGNWLSAAYARDTAVGQFPQLGPGEVSEVYNYQDESVYLLAASEIAAQGCRVFMYSGSQRPDGTLEHEEASRVGAAFNEVAKFETYLSDRTTVADIGIVQSDLAASMTSAAGVIANAIERVRGGSGHRDALLGAMKLCDHAKFAWNVIPEQQLIAAGPGELSYRLLILPDVYHITPELADRLRQFVSEGGTVIASGQTGLFDAQGRMQEEYSLSDLFGCRFEQVVTDYRGSLWGSYLKQAPESNLGLWSYMPDTTPPASELRYKIKADTAEALAYFMNPATELTEDKWVNWWYPPPANATDEPAVIVNRYGEGKTVYFSYDFFQTENNGFHLNKSMFTGLLESLVDTPSVRLQTDLPRLIGMAAYERAENKELLVHVVSHLAEKSGGDVAELTAGTLRISKSYRRLEAAECVYPDLRPLVIQEEDEYWTIEVPPVSIHRLIRIRYSS